MVQLLQVEEDPDTPRTGLADNQTWSPQLKPRWGEYDVISDDGRDCRVSDGLSRFRSNFDCCHQAEVPGSHNPTEAFGWHMLPRPFDEDLGGMIPPQSTDRFATRNPHVDVFPLHDPARKDYSGEYVLPHSTRCAIENTHRKVYCTSRYSRVYPGEVTSETDPEQPVYHDYKLPFGYEDQKPCPVFSIQSQTNHRTDTFNYMDTYGAAPPELAREAAYSREYDYESPLFSPRVDQMMYKYAYNLNQNYDDRLVPDVYHYRLPSDLHYPEEYYPDQMVPVMPGNEEEETNDDDTSGVNSRFFRPAISPVLHQDMLDLKMEMQLAKQKDVLPDQRPSVSQIPLPTIDSWTNWPHSPRLTLPQKSDTQKRFNIVHPETIPDLRDSKVYSKRVFFNGFNSSAFRG